MLYSFHNQKEMGEWSMFRLLKLFFCPGGQVLDAEYEPLRDALDRVGLSEDALRRMEPDDRVAALEKARLDPYDYIYLACL